MSCCVTSGDIEIELACVPSAIPAAERAGHFRLARELLQNLALERSERPDGYAIRFRATQFDALLRFVSNEHKCCPFLSFEISLDPKLDTASLRITGPVGTRELLRAELDLIDGCGCSKEATRE